jgi:hypothetical protein
MIKIETITPVKAKQKNAAIFDDTSSISTI